MFKFKSLVSKILVASFVLSLGFGLTVNADEEFESASDAVGAIGAGWNLGNTLDSNGTWITASAGDSKAYETAWGNPVTTKAMIDSVRDQGFNAIRIPVTWSQHIDGNGHVDQGWMKRIKEVVNYAYDDGLYVILNVHHDTGESGGDKVSWIFAENSTFDKTSNKFKGLWTEIANEFKDYGEKLLFEGYNEILDSGNTWNAPKNNSSYEAVNKYAQLFVDTVRATGGNNINRNIIVNTYVGSVDQQVLDNFKVPNDSAQGHMIIEVHCYHPWGFTGTKQSVTWTSVHNDFQSGDKSEIDGIMSRLKAFSDKTKCPVIIGEFAAEFKNNEDQIANYAGYFVDSAGKVGIKCFYWDNGDFKTSGEGGYAIFNRSKMTWKTSIVSAIVDTANKYVVAPSEPEPTPTEETTVETTAETTVETTETTVETTTETSAAPAASTEAPAEEDSQISLVPFLIVDGFLVAIALTLVYMYVSKKGQRGNR